MPRKLREVRSFPSHYLEIARFAVGGQAIAPIRADDRRAAKAIQLDFNRFRGALLDEGQMQEYEACRDLIVRLTPWSDGTWLVEFAPRHLYNLAERSKNRPEVPPPPSLDGEGLPEFPPSPIPAGLDPEQLIAKMYGIKPPADPAACHHEEDTTGGGYCIKCKKPRELW